MSKFFYIMPVAKVINQNIQSYIILLINLLILMFENNNPSHLDKVPSDY